jgi:uncharacterized damage-inducible protein DinB
MNASELLLAQFQTLHDRFASTANGLSDDLISWRPTTDANSIGFLLWHVLRTWDVYLCFVDGAEELYEQENWPQRFGFDARGRGIAGGGMGTGFTADDVALVKAQPAPLIDYLEALLTRTTRPLRTASDESLAHHVEIPWWPQGPATIADVLSHIITHSYIHLGEVYYARGLASGKPDLGG